MMHYFGSRDCSTQLYHVGKSYEALDLTFHEIYFFNVYFHKINNPGVHAKADISYRLCQSVSNLMTKMRLIGSCY